MASENDKLGNDFAIYDRRAVQTNAYMEFGKGFFKVGVSGSVDLTYITQRALSASQTGFHLF